MRRLNLSSTALISDALICSSVMVPVELGVPTPAGFYEDEYIS